MTAAEIASLVLARARSKAEAVSPSFAAAFRLVEAVVYAAANEIVTEVTISAPGVLVEDARQAGGAVVEDRRTRVIDQIIADRSEQ